MTHLTSNGVDLPVDEGHLAPLPDSSGLLEDPVALRRRYLDHGFLLLRGVVDPVLVRTLRADYFARFPPSYLAPGTDPGDGVWSGVRPADLPDHGVVGHPAHAFVRGPAFAALAVEPGLRAVAAAVLGGPCEPLPRQIVRHFDRSTRRASRAHTDHTYLDRGSDDLVTAWMPLGDCPLTTGGLIYLENSHGLGPDDLAPLRAVSDRPGDDRPLSHDLGWVAERLERRWLWADYRAGDITVHSPHAVHASLDTTTDTMRLSADLRFLRVGRHADPRWLEAWAGDDGN